MLFGHLSSNLNGDLLLQTGGLLPESERIELIEADGSRQLLRPLSSGPMELLPRGEVWLFPATTASVFSLWSTTDANRNPFLAAGNWGRSALHQGVPC